MAGPGVLNDLPLLGAFVGLGEGALDVLGGRWFLPFDVESATFLIFAAFGIVIS